MSIPVVAVLITDREFPAQIDLKLPDNLGVPAGYYEFRVGIIDRTPKNFKDYIKLLVMRELITRGIIIGKEIP